MGLGLRYFVAEDDGALTRIPVARCHRWFSGEEALPADRAGRELRLLEVVVEANRHRVEDVRRILAVRHRLTEEGRLDRIAAMRGAMRRLEITDRVAAGDRWAQIEELEADANYFWWPTDAQLALLGGALLKRPPGAAQLMELRATVYRPGASADGR